jgi:hypothetical protein
MPSEVIHFGDFACHVDSVSISNPKAPFSNSNPKDHQPIPAKTVFGHLKKHLGMSSQSAAAGNHDDPKVNRGAQLWYRCLGPGHFVRHCISLVRCQVCYNYGHIQRNCFRWRGMGRCIWAPKVSPSSGAVALETRAAQVHKMGGDTCSKHSASSSCSIQQDQTPSLYSSFPSQGSEPLPPSEAMANFAVDPLPFTPPSMTLEDGGPQRCARRTVFISGSATKMHEDCTIATTEGDLSPAQRHQLIHDINHYIVTEAQLQVMHSSLHPLGIGIFNLRNSCQRDNLGAHNPHFIGLRQVCFYLHDKVPINFRRAAFTRVSWIMLLAYPLDLKDSAIIPQVCAPFAKVLH